jgi:hypothetical protein
MLQYAVLNYSFTTNNRIKKVINETITDLAKKDSDEPEEIK